MSVSESLLKKAAKEHADRRDGGKYKKFDFFWEEFCVQFCVSLGNDKSGYQRQFYVCFPREYKPLLEVLNVNDYVNVFNCKLAEIGNFVYQEHDLREGYVLVLQTFDSENKHIKLEK